MKMRRTIISGLCVSIIAAGLSSCSNDNDFSKPTNPDDKITMAFNFTHPEQTRATETAFESGDKVGLYVCDSNLPLEIAGNFVNNEPVTFGNSEWSFSKTIYWNKGRYNAYGYYPYLESVGSITDLPFEVRTDQSTPETWNQLSGFEASDFLYASAKGIEASADPVDMTFRHIMSKITIRIIKGEDYEGEIPDDATVLIHNTVTNATIDLEAGVATKTPKAVPKTITARKVRNKTYSAIIVPQRLDNRVPFIEVVMKGVSYLYDSKFLFKQGTHHLVNFVVDKNPEQVKIEIGGEIINWN